MIPLKDSNPTERYPAVTVVLIALNVLVFLYELSIGPVRQATFVRSFALVPADLFAGSANTSALAAGTTIITSMFLHGGVLHVAGNMLFLWIFGNNIEDATGRFRFVLFYLCCGAAAALCHAARSPQSPVPMIGASGAVSGILGAYLLLYPRARVLTLVPLGFFVRVIEIPAMVVLGFWFVIQFLYALALPEASSGVAWQAHVGGFVAGGTLIGLFKRRTVPIWGGRRYKPL